MFTKNQTSLTPRKLGPTGDTTHNFVRLIYQLAKN